MGVRQLIVGGGVARGRSVWVSKFEDPMCEARFGVGLRCGASPPSRPWNVEGGLSPLRAPLYTALRVWADRTTKRATSEEAHALFAN